MNYRHAFHAGNFGDCLKHALLLWLLDAMQRKPGGVFVLDSHAGSGHYNLAADPAERTGEWRHGIARLINRDEDKLQLIPLEPGGRQQVVANPPWLALAMKLVRGL